ncbi:MAG: M48 family metalloprotease [Halobacteriota archaeon]
MNWTPDRELTVRMGVAIVLIAVLPFAFVYAMVFAANTIGIALLEALTERPWPGEFYVDPLFLAVVVAAGVVVQLRYGSKTVCSSIDARGVSPADYPELHARVNRLAWQADVPAPAVALAHNDAPNAFAVGDLWGRGTVVVTTGLLDRLPATELDAVLAHEIAHLRNRDATVMTVAWVLPTITYYLAIVAGYVLYGLVRLLGAGGRRRSGGDGKGVAMAIVAIAVSAIVTLAVSAMFWAGSVLMHRVLSRYREYAADRAAATLTGDPLSLASALARIDEAMPTVPDRDLRRLDGGVEALYVAPLEARTFDDAELVSTDIFPETHPKTADRIDRLRDLAGAIE